MTFVIIAAILGVFAITQHDAPTKEEAVPSVTLVKLSSSGICHAPQSPHFDRVKTYTAYPTLADCVTAGGALPVNR